MAAAPWAAGSSRQGVVVEVLDLVRRTACASGPHRLPSRERGVDQRRHPPGHLVHRCGPTSRSCTASSAARSGASARLASSRVAPHEVEASAASLVRGECAGVVRGGAGMALQRAALRARTAGSAVRNTLSPAPAGTPPSRCRAPRPRRRACPARARRRATISLRTPGMRATRDATVGRPRGVRIARVTSAPPAMRTRRLAVPGVVRRRRRARPRRRRRRPASSAGSTPRLKRPPR